MAPRHDEIIKKTEDGFAVAWDATVRADESRKRAVAKVVREQATELTTMFGLRGHRAAPVDRRNLRA